MSLSQDPMDAAEQWVKLVQPDTFTKHLSSIVNSNSEGTKFPTSMLDYQDKSFFWIFKNMDLSRGGPLATVISRYYGWAGRTTAKSPRLYFHIWSTSLRRQNAFSIARGTL
jgi:hypothetical protein